MNNPIRAVKHIALNRLSSSHVAGTELKDALSLVERMAARGWKVTLCPWEGSSDTPVTMRDKYLASLRSLHLAKVDGALSIKLPAMDFRGELIHRVVEHASRYNIQLRLDAQDYASTSRTLEVLERIRRIYSDVCCTVPARWRRSREDAERIVSMQAGIRIVKGQWAGPGDSPKTIRQNFLELVDIVAGRAQYVAIATHDRPLAIEAVQRLRNADTPCEIEQMVGLISNGPDLSDQIGVPLRIYIPFGQGYIPYNRTDMWHRPAIARWIVRDLLLSRNAKLSHIL